jgi:hypothetical protein
MHNDQVDREIQKTLDLFASTPQVKPGPFFYTRLKARMEGAPHPSHGLLLLQLRGAILAAVAVALLVALNAYSLLRLATHGSETQKQEAVASFAQDYSLTYDRY